ncbi:MAG: PAS domain-containing protein, partial [Pseudomonadota bacterium]
MRARVADLANRIALSIMSRLPTYAATHLRRAPAYGSCAEHVDIDRAAAVGASVFPARGASSDPAGDTAGVMRPVDGTAASVRHARDQHASGKRPRSNGGPGGSGGAGRPGGRIGFGVAAALAVTLVVALIIAAYQGAGTALILGLFTLLSAIGVFFLFSLSVGFIRLGVPNRLDHTDTLLASSPIAQLVVASDGTVLRRNGAFDDLAGVARTPTLARGPSGLRDDGLGVVDLLFRLAEEVDGESASEGGYFRLMRAARLGRSAEDMFTVTPAAHGELSGRYRITVTTLSDTDGVERATDWRVTRIGDAETVGPQPDSVLMRDISSFEGLPTGVMVVSQEGRVLSANARLRALVGFDDTAEEGGFDAHRMLVDDILPGFNALQSAAAPQTSGEKIIGGGHVTEGGRVIEGGHVTGGVQGTGLIQRIDGETRPCRVARVGYRGGSGRRLFVVEPVEPSAPARVDLDADQGAALFSASPVAIAVVESSGKIRSANEAFARMFGDAEGTLYDKVDAKSRETLAGIVTQALAGEEHPGPVDISVDEGRARTGRIFISPAQSTEGPSAIVYAIDTTKLRELEAQIAQSQ